jgi:hypothetical protein
MQVISLSCTRALGVLYGVAEAESTYYVYDVYSFMILRTKQP